LFLSFAVPTADMPALLVGDYRGDIVLLDVWGVKADIMLATDVPVEVGLS
jgi:hypothetical protein